MLTSVETAHHSPLYADISGVLAGACHLHAYPGRLSDHSNYYRHNGNRLPLLIARQASWVWASGGLERCGALQVLQIHGTRDQGR